MYQREGKAAYKADLVNTFKLVDYLENPQKRFKSIHVAGTNGKGSTSHMLASVLQEAGYKVGLYTSPHLKDFRERIRINGKMISKRAVSDFVKKHKTFFETNQLSFFEMTVGLAFNYFANKKVDIAIVEAGMGGRLDSTNVIEPEVSVITNIGLDHTQFLGNSIAAIAREKGGIVKPNIPVVIGETIALSENGGNTKRLFLSIAKKIKAPIIFAEDTPISTFKTDLLGSYQNKNLRTVITTLVTLVDKGWKIPHEAIQKGLTQTVRNTGIKGRWQLLGTQPKVVCDTAHNRDGLKMVIEQLKKEDFSRLHIVIGAANDKDLSLILDLFPKDAIYYFCKPDIPRGLNAAILEEKAAQFGLKGEVYISVNVAYKSALKSAGNEDLIFVGGSTFVVAEVL